MQYENIIVEIGEDFVASITLNRPQQFNTFSTPLAIELDQALKDMIHLPSARCSSDGAGLPPSLSQVLKSSFSRFVA